MSGAPGDPGEGPVVFDRAAGYYDETRGFPPGVEERVAELFARAGGLDRGSRVLELGIGTGRIALPLAARGVRVVGVDLSAPMLARLVEKRGALAVSPVRADAARLPFRDAAFDAVIGVHVFHLIPAWRAVLAEAARVLRPRGLLLHGADDQSGGGIWARWRERLAAQLDVENVGVPRARFERFPEDEGWRPAADPARLGFARRLRPAELLDRIAGRTWSVTWRMGEAELTQAVAALRAELLARFGDLEREVEIETGFWVRAYRAPE